MEKKTKKMNDKGFSLVELIIVIAIMAVLVGILAPQYLKYVERSRVSADEENFQQIITAVSVYYADPSNTAVDGTLTVTNGVVSTGASDAFATACSDAGVNPANITIKSSTYQNLTITFSATDYQFTTNSSDLATALAINLTTP